MLLTALVQKHLSSMKQRTHFKGYNIYIVLLAFLILGLIFSQVFSL